MFNKSNRLFLTSLIKKYKDRGKQILYIRGIIEIGFREEKALKAKKSVAGRPANKEIPPETNLESLIKAKKEKKVSIIKKPLWRIGIPKNENK